MYSTAVPKKRNTEYTYYATVLGRICPLSPRGCDSPFGTDSMMVTARVADSGLSNTVP